MKVTRKGYPPEFEQAMADMQRKRVQVGFFPEASYPDGTPVAYVAAIQEFGYPQGGIPARSFFRPTVTEKKEAWWRQFAGAMVGALSGKLPSFEAALEQIGGMAAGDVSRTISRVQTPPLSEATLKARQSRKKTKGVSEKPLVDTGQMVQAVTHQVESK